MTPQEWTRVAELFEAAANLPAEERDAWLRSTCEEEALRAEVRALLSTLERDPAYLERPLDVRAILGPGPSGVLAGRRLGAYRLTREIGRGGMGVVYEGVRDDEAFDRSVAVKVLPPWSAAMLAGRFRLERRVLASLDHPGIARLIDAGGSDDTPFCIMELVDGQPIDAWCDARRLDVPARVDLFRQVCRAVSYAHGNLVIHRDLKPSNILVTEDGQPKLLDFGIAALLDAESGASSEGTGLYSFTPSFASPEQVNGGRVTTATDVYSLGVLLYLLLAGRRPYDLTGLAPADVARALSNADPPPPSRVAPSDRVRHLRGDLDAIVAKAMRHAVTERYASVSEFAGDLQAWRDHRPVAASAITVRYTARRFVRRHRVAVSVAAAFAVVLLGGVASTVWQARIAERERALSDARFRDIRQLANAVVGPVYDAVASVPGSTEARRVLVKETLMYLDRLVTQVGSDVNLKAELADAYEKIGDVQGNLFGPNLGDAAGAKASYGHLLTLRRAVALARPGDLRAIDGVANAEVRASDMDLGEGRFDDAATGYRRALATLGGTATAPPDEARAIMVARASGRLGVALNLGGHRTDAIAAFEQSRRVAEPWAARPGASAQIKTELMSTLGNAGDVHYMAERFEDARQNFQVALDMARRAAAATATAQSRRSVHLLLTRVAAAQQELRRLDEAAGLLDESVAIQRELAVADASNVRLTFDLAASVQNQGTLAFTMGRFDQARGFLREALSLFESGLRSSPSSTEQQFNLAQTLAWVGRTEAALGHPSNGVTMIRRGLAVYAQPGVSARKPTEQFEVQVWLGDALLDIATASGAPEARLQAHAAYVAARDGLKAVAQGGEPETKTREALALAEAGIVATAVSR